MGVVVGYTSSFTVNGACANNASWNANPNSQRFFCLDGSPLPVDTLTIQKATITVNATVYAPSSSVDVSPSEGCDTLDAVSVVAVTSSLSACGAGVDVDIPSRMMPTSYSYTKNDSILPGEESWGLQSYVGSNPPTYVIRGIAEGSSTGNAGISLTSEFSSSTGNVSAQGVGRADTLEGGVVSSVGGGSSTAGDTGQGSANIPYTPLWL